MKSVPLDTTYDRQQAFNDLLRYCPGHDLSPELAFKLLSLLEDSVIGRSHASAIAREDVYGGKWEGTTALINRAVESLHKADADFSPRKLNAKYPKVFRVAMLLRDKFYFSL